jgi:polysaccharide pyruvyl transferase WcaK-like protein
MRRKEAVFDLPNLYWAPQEMMSIIASCKLAISTRYHFCLFAALQAIPFLAIKRSDKVSDLCEDLHWTFGAFPGSVDSGKLVSEAGHLLDAPSLDLGKLSNHVATMRERARRNQVALDTMLKCVGTASWFQLLRSGAPRRETVA